MDECEPLHAGSEEHIEETLKSINAYKAVAYTRPLFSSTRAVSDTKYTINIP